MGALQLLHQKKRRAEHSGDPDLDRCIREVFNRAYQALEMKSSGSVRENLDLATNNLIKMYELQAPEFLIRKAHTVQRQRLRSFRDWMRNDLALTREASPKEPRQGLTLVQGGKL